LDTIPNEQYDGRISLPNKAGQTVTIVKDGSRKVVHTDLTYDFDTEESRVRFQSLIRDRQMLRSIRTINTIRIKASHRHRPRQQLTEIVTWNPIIKIWKPNIAETPVTMTFFPIGTKEHQLSPKAIEIDLIAFRALPDMSRRGFVTLIRMDMDRFALDEVDSLTIDFERGMY
jgi:hypothetical protein